VYLLELAGNCFRVLSQTEQSPLFGRRPVPKRRAGAASCNKGVGRDIFLGGNSFRTSPSVSMKHLVGDAQAGFSVLWSKSLRLDISVALCTNFTGSEPPTTSARRRSALPGSIRPSRR